MRMHQYETLKKDFSNNLAIFTFKDKYFHIYVHFPYILRKQTRNVKYNNKINLKNVK